VLLASLTFGLLFAWPFLEARITGDHTEHHIDDRPRQRPVRTALGVATLAFYAVCFLAAGADVLSTTFGLSVNAVLWTFRIAIFVAPVVAARVTYRLCKELCVRDGLPIASKVRWRDIPGRLIGREKAPATPDVSEPDRTDEMV
jgi:ubiquinol-cytochrome c reductase cytochrome b subunit